MDRRRFVKVRAAPVLPEYLYEQGIGDTLDAMQELAGVETVMQNRISPIPCT